MTIIDPTPDADAVAALVDLAAPDEFLHIVSDREHYRAILLRRAPYALCGEYLGSDHEPPEPGPDAATCPDCQRLDRADRRSHG